MATFRNESIEERRESGSLEYPSSYKKDSVNQSANLNMSGEINFNQEQQDGQYQFEGFDIDSVVVRRSDGDDFFILNKMIDDNTQDALDLTYNYPKLLQLIETAHLSMTILDGNMQPMGIMVFNDFPPGLEGMYDYKHENAWELWLDRAFELREELNIRPYNCLWLAFSFIGTTLFFCLC